MGRDYRKIEAYQLANALAVAIYRVTKKFPKEELYGLVSQMRRSAISIPANIAEGATRRSKREYLQLLYVAKGSMAELECYLDLSRKLGYLSECSHKETEESRRIVGGKLYRLVESVEAEI